jgi:hypothetical protein
MICLSKTGRCTQETGEKLVNQSVSGLEIAAKEVQLIQIVEPEIANHTLSPEAELSSPLLTSTTSQETANPTTLEPCASDAISPMTPNTTQQPESAALALSATTANPRSLTGTPKPNKSVENRKQLLRSGDQLGLTLYALQVETYKAAMDAIKQYLDMHGSSSPNYYMSKNIQIAGICQVSGLTDPEATRKQRIAIAACLEAVGEFFIRGLELGLSKEEIKNMVNQELYRVGEFFGLGNKKAIQAREVAKRKEERAAKKAQRKAA